MIERNAIRRVLATAGGNASKGVMVMALTLSLTPVTALAQTDGSEIEGAAGSDATNTETAAPLTSEDAETSSNSIEDYTLSGGENPVSAQGASYDLTKIANGEYQGKAVADSKDPLNKGDEWDDESYDVSVTVTVADSKIVTVKVANYDTLGDNDYDRMDKAVKGYRQYEGVVGQIEKAGSTSNIDAVTTATISSNAIKTAVDNALQAAYDEQNAKPAESEYTYGYAGLTWAEYWAAEGVQAAGSAASSSDLDSRSEADKGAFDALPVQPLTTACIAAATNAPT